MKGWYDEVWPFGEERQEKLYIQCSEEACLCGEVIFELRTEG